MKGYLLAVAGTVTIASVIAAIAPEGKIAKSVKIAAKLLCLIVVAQPIADFFVQEKNEGKFSFFEKSVINTDESYVEYCRGLKIEGAQSLLEEEIFQTYGVKTRVSFSWEVADSVKNVDEEIKITAVSVVFDTPADKEKKEAIKAYITEKYGVKKVICGEKAE